MDAEAFPLAPYALRILYRLDGARRAASVAIDPRGQGLGRVSGGNQDLDWQVDLERDATSFTVAPRVTAKRIGIRLDAIEPLRLLGTGDGRAVRVLHNGWQSWSACLALGPGAAEPRPRFRFLERITRSPGAIAAPERAGEVGSELFTAATNLESGAALVAGFLRSASQFGGFAWQLRASAPPALVARLPFEGVALLPGEERAGEPLLVLQGDDALALLAAYAGFLGAAMRARVPDGGISGWCSWYEHFQRIDQAVIARNLAQARTLVERLGLELFQIDDGYQAAIGDWLEPARGFPRGVAPLAAEIGESGLTPGLWLAPFLARPGSRVAREHPDWILRDARGRPSPGVYNPRWGLVGTARSLDATHPGVREHLAKIATTIAREWGFRFLKLDFLYAAALPGERHDPHRTGAEALRLGLETVREAVGDDVRLLGCGCPLGPAIGLVDAMRIGPDVAPAWSDWLARWAGGDVGLPATRNAVRNTLARAFLHRRLWLNDPDCLLVRAERTRLDDAEVLALAGAIVLGGGSFLLSDDLAKLPEERLAIAERALELHREARDGMPLSPDLLTSGFPTLLVGARRGGGFHVLVVNPGDTACATTLSAAELGLPAEIGPEPTLHDAWSKAPLAWQDGGIDLGEIPPHGSRLLVVGA